MSRINYQLRPTKHVERKIFVDILTHLRGLGCNISDYHYIGLGSPYFIDFLLFHRYLYIRKMTSFENDSGLIGRVRFNKPYAEIKLLEEDATPSIASRIDEDDKCLIWLDYECGLTEDILNAIETLVSIVSEGSVLIVTVNAQLPNISDATRITEIEKYVELFSGSIPGLRARDITRATFKKICAKAMLARIKKGVATRTNDEFVQLFNYSYSDNAEMLSFGGIVKKKDATFKRSVKSLGYINQKIEPREISVPTLTHKERIWLDAHGRSTKTGLTREEVEKYFEFAQHYPTYYEIAI